MNLYLEEGVILLFFGDFLYYLFVVKICWEGIEVFIYLLLIYVLNVEDVVIIGKGIIDGNV